MQTEIGKKYRDTMTGAIGTATGQCVDHDRPMVQGILLPNPVDIPMTQIKLDPEHLDDADGQRRHDNRWYPNDRLEETE